MWVRIITSGVEGTTHSALSLTTKSGRNPMTPEESYKIQGLYWLHGPALSYPSHYNGLPGRGPEPSQEACPRPCDMASVLHHICCSHWVGPARPHCRTDAVPENNSQRYNWPSRLHILPRDGRYEGSIMGKVDPRVYSLCFHRWDDWRQLVWDWSYSGLYSLPGLLTQAEQEVVEHIIYFALCKSLESARDESCKY